MKKKLSIFMSFCRKTGFCGRFQYMGIAFSNDCAIMSKVKIGQVFSLFCVQKIGIAVPIGTECQAE